MQVLDALGGFQELEVLCEISMMRKANITCYQSIKILRRVVDRRLYISPERPAVHVRCDKARKKAVLGECFRVDADERQDVPMAQLPPDQRLPAQRLS
jgi:hypothetical protein